MKKIIKNLIIFVVLIILTFYIILKDQDITQIFSVLKNVNKFYIIIAIICMILYFVCESFNTRRTLKTLNEKTTLIKNLKYTLIGFFFSSITPAASGGQPMQVYYMYKDNISTANSTLALLINLSCVQIVTLSIALFSVFFNYTYLTGFLLILFIIGITLNSLALTLWIIAIFSKKLSRGLINITVKILKCFKVKNIESKQEKIENELKKYQENAVYVKRNPKLILRNLITTYIQFILYYSISYWTYCSFGLSSHNAFQIITLQSILYGTVSGIPSPGAVGVTEGGYLAIFESIYPATILSGGMLLTRAVNFYLFVIISALVVIINTMRTKKANLENNK